MAIQKLLKIALDSLTKQQLKNFEKFLSSPYFSKKHYHTGKCLDLLKFYSSKEYSLSYRNKSLSEIYKKLYPRSGVNNAIKKVQKILWDLYSYFFDFLVYEGLKKNRALFNIILLKQIDGMDIEEIFVGYAKTKNFNKIYVGDAETENFYYYQLYSIINKHRGKSHRPIDLGDYETEITLLNKFYASAFLGILTRAEISALKHNDYY